MKTQKRKRLAPLHTAIANLFFPGLGQYFNKQPVKMILFMIAIVVGSTLIFYSGITLSDEGKFSTSRSFILVGYGFFISIIACIDAYRVATKQRKGSNANL